LRLNHEEESLHGEKGCLIPGEFQSRIFHKEPISDWVDPEVEAYIQRRSLYTGMPQTRTTQFLIDEVRPLNGFVDGVPQGKVSWMGVKTSNIAAVELAFDPRNDPTEKLARIQFPTAGEAE